MWLETWQQFGKHTIWDLRGVAHRGKKIHVVAGISAQRSSTHYFFCALVGGKVKRHKAEEESASRARKAWLTEIWGCQLRPG